MKCCLRTGGGSHCVGQGLVGIGRVRHGLRQHVPHIQQLIQDPLMLGWGRWAFELGLSLRLFEIYFDAINVG